MRKSSKNIDTGSLLNDFIKKNKIRKSHLGDQIGRSGTAVTAYLGYDSIQTGILIEICHALKHNFFSDIAQRLPEDFTKTTDNKMITEKDQMIAQLQEEIKVLAIQNDIMKKALGIKE